MIDPSHKTLSLVLILTGIVFVLLYPIMNILPETWGWEPHYIERHLSLIWFIAVSNIVHGGLMLVQALVDPAEHPNLFGDIPALIVTGIVIASRAPKRLSPR